MMFEHIQFDENTPIAKQLPSGFKSAAILLNPFIQMSMKWINSKNKSPNEQLYPNSQEIVEYGKPVSWDKIVLDCKFDNSKELALAVKTSIGAFNKEYSRPDLSTKLKLHDDIFFPCEDSISI